jgi:hypothetical protein
MQTPSVASIPNALVVVTFIQVWETESASYQEEWLDTMRANIDLLRTKPGFVSMLVHRSLDPSTQRLFFSAEFLMCVDAVGYSVGALRPVKESKHEPVRRQCRITHSD